MGALQLDLTISALGGKQGLRVGIFEVKGEKE
jgi:hypothetical protein